MNRRQPIAKELEGALARTQEIARQTLEAVNAIARALAANPQALYYITKVTPAGTLFASWYRTHRSVKWTPRHHLATSFPRADSVAAALQGLGEPKKGDAYEIIRILP